MAKDYSKPANTALKLITKFGGPAELIKQEGVLIDPNDPAEGEELNPIAYSTQAVELPISKDDTRYLPTNTAINQARKFLMEAVNLEKDPEVSDIVKQYGIEWNIISIKPLKPAEVDVLWTLYVSA